MEQNARYWCVTDLETTGLDPDRHEIIQIARVVVDALEKELRPELTMSQFVLPCRWEQRDPEAMEVNKINLPKLQSEGLPIAEALQEFVDGLDWTQTVLAGWGVTFEANFLNKSFEESGMQSPIHYKTIDVRGLAHLTRAKTGMINYLGLGESCRYFGIPFDEGQLHDALYDATKTAELAAKLLF